MKFPIFFLILFFAAPESFSQVNKSDQDFTYVSHYRNNISLRNSDGTRSTIYVNGGSATLTNSDGTQSIINFCCGNSSTLIAIDGTSSSVLHNGPSSTLINSDGTQYIVNHMRSTSSFSTAEGKHTITHNFGAWCEMRYKDEIDMLIHWNWLMQKRIAEAEVE